MSEEQQKTNSSQKNSSKNTLKAFSGALILVVILATFTSGYLIGSGKVGLSFDGRSAQINRSEDAPEEGIDELYSALLKNYDGEITDEEALEGLKSGLVEATGDPYSEYLSAEEKAEFEDSLNGSFEGIGAELSKEGNYIGVVAPIKGTPAFRAGIQPKDIIIEVDGESTAGISVSEAVKRIRGPKGEEVKLKIARDGKQLDINIIRDTITIKSVEWRVEGTVGVIEIARFGGDTTDLMHQAAQDLNSKNVSGIILDLRGNPGGLLDSAVAISSMWLDSGKDVLLEKRGGEVVQTFRSNGSGEFKGLKTVVLIDGGSASASEIVAGALRDNGVATLLGQTSYGKGSVQRLINLSDGGSLKVTIARWYTPNDKNIDKEGLKPDKEVENKQDSEADEQFNSALEMF